jgi:hypothetical protein
MEIEGFGSPLTGHTVWIVRDAWIPWEFIPQTPCRMLLTGSAATTVYGEPWTYILYPTTQKDWSCAATILKAFGSGVVAWTSDLIIPPSFLRFLESGTYTRIMMGYTTEPPLFPDAIFFPHSKTPDPLVLSICKAMPSRKGHAGYTVHSQWDDIVTMVGDSGMSLLITDVEETKWTLFWYKRSDSTQLTETTGKAQALQLIKAATSLLEM